jgi:hypothetical protein
MGKPGEMSGRDTLEKYWATRGEEKKEQYWRKHNVQSIDGLPTGMDEAPSESSKTSSKTRG